MWDWVGTAAAVIWWGGIVVIGMIGRADEDIRPRYFKQIAVAWIFVPLALIAVLISTGVVGYVPFSTKSPYVPWIVAAACIVVPFILLALFFHVRVGRPMRREDLYDLIDRIFHRGGR